MSKSLIDRSRALRPTRLPMPGLPEYSNWMDEQMSWKTACYVGDWSFLPALVVEGRDALMLLSRTTVNTFAKFDVGQAKHAIQCDDNGKVIAEGVLLRLDEEKFCIQSIPAFYTAYMALQGRYDVKVQYVDWFFFQVQGPNAFKLCEKLTASSLKEVGFMRFVKREIAGQQVLALRQGMGGGLGGFEFQGINGAPGRPVYDAILETGAEFGIRRLGTRTIMINHLEAWFPTVNQHYLPAHYGPEMQGFRDYLSSDVPLEQGVPQDRLVYLKRQAEPRNISGSFEGADISDYYRSPVEMGWARNIKFDHEFRGRAALEAEVANPVRVGATLDFDPDGILKVYASLFSRGEHYDFLDLPHCGQSTVHASRIEKDGKLVGISTRPAYSYYFRKVLAISFVAPEVSTPGEIVEVVWGEPGHPQIKLRTKVCGFPYQTDHRRAVLG
jgi:vanillate/3-O-methylgallate O-demethylase